ncbi:hypothetical protein H072_10278 [Dactylellina haptotyla CBS 200.50]|uniref:BTB domain-containing protein n=1 Tax=Dactylellina haptotyla (strain CBS 200.50) TaxID=1284197 RepID=S8A512_DACHA|nr:hypothetical protein H072_10278 [Dactylellina haptotyla CBS 200.50]
MNFTAPLYIPGNTDITLLIGPDEIKFEANCNILASQSKFFATACYDERFKEAKEKVIKLPELHFPDMIGVLKWLYREDPEVYDNFKDSEPTRRILEILKVADFLQVDGLVKDYSRLLEKKLRCADPRNHEQIYNFVTLIHRIYEAGGSIGRGELQIFVNNLIKSDDSDEKIIHLRNVFANIEQPDGKCFRDFADIFLLNIFGTI